jgi:hypothetical protein
MDAFLCCSGIGFIAVIICVTIYALCAAAADMDDMMGTR